MAIYLVQHGKSLSKKEDGEQGLSAEGKEEVNLIAGVAKNYTIKVEKIIHSGKKRARQTAQIFADALEPSQGIEERAGLKPLDDVSLLASQLLGSEQCMLVGHLPFMEKLVCQLITGTTDHRIFKFQNGGIVCLDQEEGAWYIKWALMPNVR